MLISRLFLSIFFFLFLVACTKQKPEIKIGFSHADLSDPWGNLMYQEVVNEIRLYHDYNIKLVVTDARRNSQKQVSDIGYLAKNKIDVLIVFAIDENSTVKEVNKIFDSGIPVVLVDRKLNTNKYSTLISNDNVKIGFTAGKYALEKLKDKGIILEICGFRNSSTSLERSTGFRDAIQNMKNIRVGQCIYGNWLEDITALRLDSLYKTGFKPDLIFAHSDIMAQSAHHVSDKYNLKPVILGVDGLPNKNGGIEMVINQQINATFYNYPGGDKAVQCAMSLIQKRETPKEIILKSFPIDLSNAESIKVAYELQLEQFEKIKSQQVQIGKMTMTLESRNIFIYFSIAFIASLLFIVLVIVYYLRQKQHYIALIKGQKEKIEQQMEEERSLTDQLNTSHEILKDQSLKIIEKNEFLEKYQNHLEKLVHERTKDLESALKKAQESDKLKTSFLSNLSHEIRTPLNSIMGFTDLLTTSNYPSSENEKFRAIIIQNSNQLLNSITELVEISKLSTEHIDFEKSVISTSRLFKELNGRILNYINQESDIKNKNIEFKILDFEDVNIEVDILKIIQVITYLLENAFKFTEHGYVHLGLEIIDKRNVKFFVKDSGIGIKKENQEIIFDRFRKIEENTEVIFRGIGLGLAIAKEIVEQMGGLIALQSEYGKGSEFSVYMPGVIVDNPDFNAINPESRMSDIKSKSILIAEDEDSNFYYLEALLNQKQATITHARNGAEAVRFCQVQRFDIILMDIKMPIMGGVEAFRKIRTIHPKVPVLAITAYAFINEERLILKEGFNGYLSKPFKPETILKAIEDLLFGY